MCYTQAWASCNNVVDLKEIWQLLLRHYCLIILLLLHFIILLANPCIICLCFLCTVISLLWCSPLGCFVLLCSFYVVFFFLVELLSITFVLKHNNSDVTSNTSLCKSGQWMKWSNASLIPFCQCLTLKNWR